MEPTETNKGTQEAVPSSELLCDTLSKDAKEALMWLLTSQVAGAGTVQKARETIAIVWGAGVSAELKAFLTCSHSVKPSRPAGDNQ